MFIPANTPVQITKSVYEEPVSGIVLTAMIFGALVAERSSGTVGDPAELVACGAGQRPAILERKVVVDADWQAYMKADPQWRSDLTAPVPAGSCVTARYAKQAQFEGAAFFTAIDGTSAAGLALKVVAGKFVAATVGTDRIVAYLVKKITPVDSASFRWLVEFVD